MRTYQKHAALSMMLTLPRISLPIPCQALRQGIEIPCRFTGIRSQGIDYPRISAGHRENFPLFPGRQGNSRCAPDTVRSASGDRCNPSKEAINRFGVA
jgi:hypothetical protein